MIRAYHDARGDTARTDAADQPRPRGREVVADLRLGAGTDSALHQRDAVGDPVGLHVLPRHVDVLGDRLQADGRGVGVVEQQRTLSGIGHRFRLTGRCAA